jgi:hypothetical protein
MALEPTAYYDFFRKIVLQPDGVTLEADNTSDTLTITGGNGVALNPNSTNDSFEIDVDYSLYVPIGSTAITLQDVNSNATGVTLTAGSNISIGRNSDNELVITGTVGGTSKSISNASQTNPVVITTTSQHQFTEGIPVTITDVVGMTELNGNEYYMDVLTSTTFALYEDANLTTPVNGTGFTPYSTGGVATAEYGAPQNLTQLGDVDFTVVPPTEGDFLKYSSGFWGASSSLAWTNISSTPTTIAGYGITDAVADFADLGTTPTTIAGYGITDAFDGAYSSLTGTPTTLAGYGITDAATSAQGALADSALQPGDSISAADITGAKATEWDLAYGWGDHSLAGYLTSVTLDDVLTTGNSSATGIDVGASTIGGVTITGTTLDTTDSSPLVITPSVTFDTEITVSDVVPSLNTAIDLGSSSLRYREVHSQTINTVDPSQAGFAGDGRVRTNRLYFGDESFTSYLYASSTGSFSWVGSMDPGNIFHNRSSTYARWKSTGQLVYNHTNPNGTVDIDFLLSDTHYFYQPTGALTVNFTNIPTGGSRMYNMRIYIYQGLTAYIPTSFQVNGAAQNVDWQNGVIPAGTVGNIDFIQCLVWSFGNGTYTLLAQANSYS